MKSEQQAQPVNAPARNRVVRWGYFVLGLALVGLGIIGALLPVMPTTVFLIGAAWCFARSTPRWESWLLNHPSFGPVLRNWQARGAIAPRAKAYACSGIAAGYAIFFLSAKPGLWLALGVGAFMLASAAYILTRPSA